YCTSFCVYWMRALPHLHAFPTRRSSDLEEVSLALNQRGRQALGAQGVVVRERGGKHRNRVPLGGRGPDDAAPRVHQTRHLLQEVLIQQQGRQLRVSLIGIDDAVEETGADNAATTPDAGQVPGVDVPTVFFRTREDLVEALGIGDHLRRVKRATDVLDEVRTLGGVYWGSQLTGSELALGGLAGRAIRGERAGKHRLTDTGDRDAQVAGGLHGPAARALLAGSVHDDVHQRLAGFGIDLRQDLRVDLHEVGLQLAGVPLAEN